MLNRCYRIVWHTASQTWQVVSELAKGKTKSHQTKKIAPILFTAAIPTFLTSFAWAENVSSAMNENTNSHRVTIEQKHRLSGDYYGGVVYALSADGKVAGGESDYLPALWLGKNWQTKINLGFLNELARALSFPLAFSADGKIAGGWSRKVHGDQRAIIWSGDNWQTKTDLGTLKIDNSGDSLVSALSLDGRIAGGHADNDKDEMRAIIWSGDNWQTKTDLGTLRVNNDGNALVQALSADGKIAGGESRNANNDRRPIIWSGDNWQTKTDLGTLNKDNSGGGIVNAFSADGKIAGGGWSNNGTEWSNSNHWTQLRAIIWSGDNWQTKTDLGTLRIDNLGDSKVDALSADGKIAGGRSDNDNDEIRATIWSGKNWQTKTDLGTLRADNRGWSILQALSADGTLAGGSANADDEENRMYATLWRIKYHEPEVEIVGKINRDFTINALQQLGADSMSLMSMQQQALNRLQQGCYTDQTFCYAVRSDWVKGRDHRDTAVGFSLGYHFGNGFLLGLNADRSLQRSLPESYKRNRNNLGWGVFARWQGENWYIAPAVAWDYYDAQVKRPLLPNTETEQHTSRIKGFGTSLTLGQDFTLSNNMKFGWYSALRYQRISRSGYSEQRVAFPVSFGDMRLKETTIALGATFSVPLTDKLRWSNHAEIEQRVSSANPTYTASAQHIGNFSYEGKLNRTRGKVSTGLSYQFSPAFSVEVSTYLERSSFGKNRYGGTLTLSGSF